MIGWLSRHLVGVAVAAALAAAATAAITFNRWLTDREAAAVESDRQARRIADLEAEIRARAEAAAVQRAHAERLAGQLAASQERLRQIQSLEGLDDPLPDALARAAQLLWPR